MKYKPFCSRSYIKLPEELDHPRKRLTENVWKDLAKELDFKDTSFPIKIRDIHKIEKNNWIRGNIFDYIN